MTLTKLMDWESNTRLRNEIAKIAMPQTEIHSIPIANGFTGKVLLQLPPKMDRSGKTKYPMLVDVYGGPDTVSVSILTLSWRTNLIFFLRYHCRLPANGIWIGVPIYHRINQLYMLKLMDVGRDCAVKIYYIPFT